MTRPVPPQAAAATPNATVPPGDEPPAKSKASSGTGAAEGAPREEDEPLSEKVYGWAHRAREAGEDVAADEWDWHAQAVEALESQLAQERAALARMDSAHAKQAERAIAAEAKAEEYRASLLLAEQAIEYNQTVVLRAEAAREKAEADRDGAKAWAVRAMQDCHGIEARHIEEQRARQAATSLLEEMAGALTELVWLKNHKDTK